MWAKLSPQIIVPGAYSTRGYLCCIFQIISILSDWLFSRLAGETMHVLVRRGRVHVPVRMSCTSSSCCTPTAKQPLAPKSVPLFPPKCLSQLFQRMSCLYCFLSWHDQCACKTCASSMYTSCSMSQCVALCCCVKRMPTSCGVSQCVASCCGVKITYQFEDKRSWPVHRTRLVRPCSLINQSRHTYQSSCPIYFPNTCASSHTYVALECLCYLWVASHIWTSSGTRIAES